MTAGVGVPGVLSPGHITGPRSRGLAGPRNAVQGAASVLRKVGATLLAGLDGFVVGLVSAAAVAAFASGVEKHLGVPWPIESLVSGGGMLVLALAGAIPVWLLQQLLVRGGRFVDRRLAGRGGRVGGVVLRVDRGIVRAVAGLPAPWLGAMVLILVLANTAGSTSVIGLALPSGALTPYINVAGVVVALAAAAWRLTAGLWRSFSRVRLTTIAAAGSAAILLASGAGIVLVGPGSTSGLVGAAAAFDGTAGPIPTPSDPGLPGTYAVRSLTYGSGHDQRRPEFGVEATIATPTIDASGVLGRLGGGSDEARTWFFGFDTSALPLNGTASLRIVVDRAKAGALWLAEVALTEG